MPQVREAELPAYFVPSTHEIMVGMKKAMWTLLILVEVGTAFVLARPAVLNAIKVANTRREVLDPNWAYFAAMLLGDALKLVIPVLLLWNTVWIIRKRNCFLAQ